MTQNRLPPTRRNAFLRLVALGVVVRLAYFVQHADSPFFGVPFLDGQYYDQFARALLGEGDPARFIGFRPILYPLFLSAMYRIGGSFSVAFALLAQHTLGILTAVLVAVIASRLFRSPVAGVTAGALYLLGAPPLFLEGELLVESVYVSLIAMSLLAHTAALRSTRRGGRRAALAWGLAGATVALAGQAHSKVLVFVLFYPLCALRRLSPVPLSGLAGALAILMLFGVVNGRPTATLQVVPGYGGINLYLGNRRGADGMIPQQGAWTTYHGDEYRDSVEVYARQEYEKAMWARGEEPLAAHSAVSAYWTRRTLEEIRAAPGAWLRLMIRKLWLLLWNHEIPNNRSLSFYQEHESWLLRLLPVRWFLLLALAPLGIALARRSGDREVLFMLVSFLALYSAAVVAFFVNGRYRMSLWPAMAVLAGGGVRELWLALRERARSRLAVHGAIGAALALVSLVNWPGVERPSHGRDFWSRSLAWYERGRPEKALEDIRESLKLDPENAKAQLHLGNALFVLGRYPEARQAYETATQRDPREPRGWNNLGRTCEAMGELDVARRHYQRALELDPRDRTARQNLDRLANK